MKLPQQLKTNVLDELEFVIKKMKEEPDILKKLYYYSAVKGSLERATRYYIDNELLVTQTIVDVSFALINDRISHIKLGDTIVPFTETILEKLIESISELRQAIEKDETTYPAIEKIMEAAYMTTGPGFYTRSFLDYVNTVKK